MNTDVSLSDYDPQLALLQRQQKLAEMMQQQGQEPIQPTAYNGIQAPVSPYAELAKALQQYAGGMISHNAFQKQQDLSSQARTQAATDAKNLFQKPYAGDAQQAEPTEIGQVNVTPRVGSPVAKSADEQLAAALQQVNSGNPYTRQLASSVLPGVLQNSFKDDTPITVHRGDTVINRKGEQLFSAPEAPNYAGAPYQKPGADGTMHLFAKDANSGAEKDLGPAPPKTQVVNGVVTDLNTAKPGDIVGGKKPASAADFQRWGVDPKTLPPGTVVLVNPDGTPSREALGDVKSQGAIQQERDTAVANNPVLAVIRKIQKGDPLTDEDNRILQIEKPNAAVNDDAVKQTAQSIAKYQLAPLSGFAMRSPFGQAVMAKVTELNPDYQAQNFTKSQAGYKAFASGKQGDQMRFADNAIGHMNTALQLADALGNGNTPLINSISQVFAQQTGSPAPTNFDTAKQIIAGEVVKAITGAGGALADRQEAQSAFSRASSPAQLKGAIKTAQTLLARQLQGLGRQYKNSTMRDDFVTQVSPESQALLGSESGSHAAPRTVHFNDLPK